MIIFNYGNYSDDSVLVNHLKKKIKDMSKYIPHSHECYEILFCKKGSVTYTVGGQEYRLAPNDLVFTRPLDIHKVSVVPDDLYERYTILFVDNVVPDSILSKIPHDLDVISFENNQTIIDIFKKIDFYCENLSGDELGLVIKNLTQEICVHIALEAKSSAVQIHKYTNPLIADAINYIDQNLLTLTDVQEICDQLFITKRHLYNLFDKYLKISPKKYIVTKRLALAQKELLAGGKPTDVFSKCGFSDYSSFFRAYKNYFNRAPSSKNSAEELSVTRGKIVIAKPSKGKD